MSARHPRPAMSDRDLATTWQAASMLLDYPDEHLLEWLPLLGAACEGLPTGCAEPLGRLVDHVDRTRPRELQARYVETFDNRRRHSLFLTYFAHGDTRKRGVALLRFKQTYLRSGFVLADDGRGAGELPDHLCVVLEYAATVDRRLGWGLLLDHRAGLEILRMSLRDEGSPWAGAVEAVCATLPPLGGEERDAVRRLAAAGPPEEEVGLTPYATPGFDPGPAPPPGVPSPELLPMPSFPGGR
jgi:nitrate reductase molybdenum cofactor assembly chaperone NarJ/NarW